jgi:hypothetical protein
VNGELDDKQLLVSDPVISGTTTIVGLGRPEDALAASQKAVTIHRELAARWPGACRH